MIIRSCDGRLGPAGTRVQVVQMAIPFRFGNRLYGAGGWIVLSPERDALTAREYRDEVGKPSAEQEW